MQRLIVRELFHEFFQIAGKNIPYGHWSRIIDIFVLQGVLVLLELIKLPAEMIMLLRQTLNLRSCVGYPPGGVQQAPWHG